MSLRIGTTIACVALAALVAAPVLARGPDLDVERLQSRLRHLQEDPALQRLATAERARARDAVRNLAAADRKSRPHWLYIAERRIDLAWAAAQLEEARAAGEELQREREQIMLEATRQEAARVRRELERVRVQNLAAQEEAARLREEGQSYATQAEQARAEAEQARRIADTEAQAAALSRRQAELAEAAARSLRASMENLQARRGAQGLEMVLGSTAFASGQARLEPEVARHLGKLVQFVQSAPDKPVLIEGYTDSSGSAERNTELSRQRAGAVRDALVAAGVDAARVSVAGRGAANPVASNDTASGRARNRRVLVILKD